MLRALREELGSKAVLVAEVDNEPPSVLGKGEVPTAPNLERLNVPVGLRDLSAIHNSHNLECSFVQPYTEIG